MSRETRERERESESERDLRERETLLGNHVHDEGVKGTGSVTIKYVT